jgi:hypothetical protein
VTVAEIGGDTPGQRPDLQAVSETRHRVLHECVTEEVELLTAGPDAAGATEGEVIVDLPVGGLGVAAQPLEALVLAVGAGDLANVLSPIDRVSLSRRELAIQQRAVRRTARLGGLIGERRAVP